MYPLNLTGGKAITDHKHCPEGCEHPQPMLAEDGTEYCGSHWYFDRVLVEMVECDHQTCGEEDVPVTPDQRKEERNANRCVG